MRNLCYVMEEAGLHDSVAKLQRSIYVAAHARAY
jgi:hypothetical protein